MIDRVQKAEQLYQEAISKPRDPRSEEYLAGVKNAILHRLTAKLFDGTMPSPYAVGTVQADAYFAGCQEGLHHATEWEKEQKAKDRDAGQER
jgi:hypothetical protein